MLNIFLFNKFSEKSNIFWENLEKLFFRRIWQFYKNRRRFAPKINITFLSQMRFWILHYLAVFSKTAVFSVKTAKPQFWGPSLFWRERDVRRWKWIYNLFYGKWGFEYFFHLTIFSKKATFLEKMGKNNFGGIWPFFRRGHLTLKMNIIFFIEN